MSFLVIFDCQAFNPELTNDEIPGTLYGLSSNGWIDKDLFSDHFLAYAPSYRPLLLLLDGHSSHYCPEVIKMAARVGIIVFTLPPNTTHITQSLDRSCFSPLKLQWRQVVQNFNAQNCRSVNRYDFCSLFSQAWVNAMIMKNIIAGFRKCRVYPFNRAAIVPPEEDYSTLKPKAVPEIVGLNYVPVYTPVQHCTESSSALLSPATSPHEVLCKLSQFQSLLSPPCTPGPPLNLSPQSRFLQDVFTPVFYGTDLLGSEPDCRVVSLCQKSHDIMPVYDQSQRSMPFKRPSSLSHLLITPIPPCKTQVERKKSSGRVLTSLENLKLLEEKEEKKATNPQRKRREEKAS